jgi:hypothetical protein
MRVMGAGAGSGEREKEREREENTGMCLRNTKRSASTDVDINRRIILKLILK